MSTCDRSCLEALERELNRAIKANSRDASHRIDDGRYFAIMDFRAVVRAALNAGPSAEPSTPAPSSDGACAETAGGLVYFVPEAEFSRLRAWEKWGREVAKPALERYKAINMLEGASFCTNMGYSQAASALAAMPKESQP